MIHTQDLEVVRNLFPFSGIEELSVVKEDILRVAKKETEEVMALPVNNYLKTHEEIEMEFQYGINLRKALTQNMKSNLNIGVSIIKTDGYINIHNPDETLSGFMEENY